MEPPLRSDPLVRMLGHTTVALVLFTLAYYVLPFRVATDEPLTLGRLAVSVLALAGLATLFRLDLRRSAAKQNRKYLRIQWLLTALYALVLAFALAYAVLETVSEGQFVGLDDRTDALYFSVTLVATVGFGDIHPSATAAQLVATAHMLFNVVYLGTALRLLTSRDDQAPPDLIPRA